MQAQSLHAVPGIPAGDRGMLKSAFDLSSPREGEGGLHRAPRRPQILTLQSSRAWVKVG